MSDLLAGGPYFQDAWFISPDAGGWFEDTGAINTAREEGVPPRLRLALELLIEGVEYSTFFADFVDYYGATSVRKSSEAIQLLRELAARLESELIAQGGGAE